MRSCAVSFIVAIGCGAAAHAACDPELQAYPVFGAHNGGWDGGPPSLTCPPHADDSDFDAAQHPANDIFAAAGTEVVAPVDGQIINLSESVSDGLTVTFADDCGWFYYYASLGSIAPGIAIGQPISAGDPVGAVGTTADELSDAPHVHLAIWEAGVVDAPIDPFALLEAVDASSCPPQAILSLSASTSAADVRPEGASAGVPDVFEGDAFQVTVAVTADPTGGPLTAATLQYAVSGPWLLAADGFKSGALTIGPLAPGAQQIATFDLLAAEYSLAEPEHPRFEVSLGELTADLPHDVYGKTHWEFDGGSAQTEGWFPGNVITAAVVDTTAHAISISQGGADAIIISPPIDLDAAVYKGLELRVRHQAGLQTGQVYWLNAPGQAFDPARSVVYEIAGDGAFHTVTINAAAHPLWTGQIAGLRLDPTDSVAGSYDIDYIRAIQSPGKTTGDGDGDQLVASQDCDDTNPAPIEPAPELCDSLDNDCDGDTDEDFALLEPCTVGEAECASEGFNACADDGGVYCKAPVVEGVDERCDGLDNDCDGLIDEGFSAGEPCDIVEGACTKIGVWVCDPTGALTICDAAGAPCVDTDGPGPGPGATDTPEDQTTSRGGGTAGPATTLAADSAGGSGCSTSLRGRRGAPQAGLAMLLFALLWIRTRRVRSSY